MVPEHGMPEKVPEGSTEREEWDKVQQREAGETRDRAEAAARQAADAAAAAEKKATSDGATQEDKDAAAEAKKKADEARTPWESGRAGNPVPRKESR